MFEAIWMLTGLACIGDTILGKAQHVAHCSCAVDVVCQHQHNHTNLTTFKHDSSRGLLCCRFQGAWTGRSSHTIMASLQAAHSWGALQESTWGLSRGVGNKWGMLRNSEDAKLCLPKDAKPIHLVLVHRFLWKHKTEEGLSRFFGAGCGLASERSVCKWIWFHTPEIQLLLKELMGKLEDADEGLVFVFSVDGTHCPIKEPRPFLT